MPFIAFMASGLLLKVSVLISIIDLPSGFLAVTEHLCGRCALRHVELGGESRRDHACHEQAGNQIFLH